MNLTLQYFGKIAELDWSDLDALKRCYKIQVASNRWPTEDFFAVMKSVVEWNWNRIVPHLNLVKIKKVVDVGSGVAIFDLMLSQYIDAVFHLVDKSAFESGAGPVYYSDNHGFYNSWNVVTDAIRTSGLAADRFNFIGPVDEWPTEVDLVISMHSWCWHYPKDTYWKKALHSLKTGGYLVLDIIHLPNRDMITEISNEFGVAPILTTPLFPRQNHPFTKWHVLKNGSHGTTCIWVKP